MGLGRIVVGDYYICLGNKDDGKPTSYDYIFPWWVKGGYYQIVNNNQVMDIIIDTVSAYDYYEIPNNILKNGLTFKGWYIDRACSKLYKRNLIS